MTTSTPTRFGIQTGQQGVEWAQMLDLWQKADGWGYHSLWLFDHFYPIFVDPEGPCFEGWTILGALAQATRRARIGLLVSGNSYRHPCVTAKMAATLDHVSGGRLNLGIGAGWFEVEHRAFGIEFKSIVARHADMWNIGASAAEMRDLIGVIRRHGDAVGRDADAIEKTVLLPLCYRAAPPREQFICQLMASMRETTPELVRREIMIGDKQECLDTVARYVEAGVKHFI